MVISEPRMGKNRINKIPGRTPGIWHGSRFIKILPFIMGEGLIGFSHFMSIFLLFNRCSSIIVRIQDLAGKALEHCLLRPSPGVVNQPAYAEGLPSLRPDFNRDLVGSASDPPRFHLYERL